MRDLLKRFSPRKKALLAAAGMLIAVLFSVLAFSPACKDAVSAYREEAALLKIIKSTGAQYKSTNVTGWVRVDENAGAYEPETLAGMVAAQLSVPEAGRQVEKWENQFARGAKVAGPAKGGRTVAVMGQVMEPQQGKPVVSHIMVVLDGAAGGKTGAYKSKINAALGVYGESQVALTCSGIIYNELNKDELLEAAEKIMIQAGAAVHEKTIKDNLVSLTGFSPRFVKDITYAGKEINLNVALRCDPVEHVTYVYAASPVIFTEY